MGYFLVCWAVASLDTLLFGCESMTMASTCFWDTGEYHCRRRTSFKDGTFTSAPCFKGVRAVGDVMLFDWLLR